MIRRTRWTLRMLEKLSPLRYALFCSGVYLLFAVLWIRYSSLIAGSSANSVEELQTIEIWKGIGFVSLSSLLFFVFSMSVFRVLASGVEKLLQSQQRLVQAEREAMTGLIASSVAHDISNLLTVLRLNVERLKTLQTMPERAVESVSKLDHGVTRLTELADRMRMAGANILKSRPQRFDLTTTIHETIGLLRTHSAIIGCEIELKSSGAHAPKGYPVLIHQILMNLVLNAAEATESSGKILVQAKHEGDEWVLEVHDSGPGVSPALRESIFEAFFTTKPLGSGLGLVSVRSCVEILGGEIEVADSPLGGACFKIHLPDSGEAPQVDLQSSELVSYSSTLVREKDLV